MQQLLVALTFISIVVLPALVAARATAEPKPRSGQTRG